MCVGIFLATLYKPIFFPGVVAISEMLLAVRSFLRCLSTSHITRDRVYGVHQKDKLSSTTLHHTDH